ncbi:hypothetical protein HXY33_02370 [Candidatus Bathyarchaeota archaeon]|nr:hypothetical protein [Candidatus Bathyarchaeota archaeon]
MTGGKELTRQMIIQTLVNALEPLDYAYAFYEGGAAAFNRIDEWSDIDLYLIVDEKKADKAFAIVDKALESLSPIKRKIVVPQLPWPGVSQVFYKLERASDYLIIDFCVLTLNSSEKFLEPETHGNVVFYFNKSAKVQPPSLEKDVLVKKLRNRLERLKARIELFNSFVQKEINRGNLLEAVDNYHNLTLATLVEILRIKHNSIHYEFKMRYIHYELPPEITKRLVRLYFVRDEKDLQMKYDEATEWLHKIMSELDETYASSS